MAYPAGPRPACRMHSATRREPGPRQCCQRCFYTQSEKPPQLIELRGLSDAGSPGRTLSEPPRRSCTHLRRRRCRAASFRRTDRRTRSAEVAPTSGLGPQAAPIGSGFTRARSKNSPLRRQIPKTFALVPNAQFLGLELGAAGALRSDLPLKRRIIASAESLSAPSPAPADTR